MVRSSESQPEMLNAVYYCSSLDLGLMGHDGQRTYSQSLEIASSILSRTRLLMLRGHGTVRFRNDCTNLNDGWLANQL